MKSSNRRVFTVYFLVFCVFATGCATPYQAALKCFQSGQSASAESRSGKTFRKYQQTLERLKELTLEPAHKFLEATIYHQLYTMDASTIWEGLGKSIQSRCPYIGKIIAAHSADKPDGFLMLAFETVLEAEALLKKSPHLAPSDEWYRVEKGIIIGDVLSAAAEQPEPNTIKGHLQNEVPEEFINNIRRYTFYETARIFYLDSFVKLAGFMADHSSVNLNWLAELSRKRLKNSLYSLASVSTQLSYQNRSEEFRNFFRLKTPQYLEIINRLDGITLPLPAEASTEDKILGTLGMKPEKNYLVIDTLYHLKEGRVKVSTAIDEMLAQKKEVLPYFLDTLKHCSIVLMLDKLSNPSEEALLASLTEDAYLNLYRLSE